MTTARHTEGGSVVHAVGATVVVGACLMLGGCQFFDSQTKDAAGTFAADVTMGAANAGLEGVGEAMQPQARAGPVYAKDFRRMYPLPTTGPEPTSTLAAAAPVTARNTKGQTIEVDVVPPSVAGGGVGEVAVTPESPVFVAGPGAAAVGETVQVDAIVGAINGKPVRASEFLTPMAAVLSAKVHEQGMTREQWRMFAAQKIAENLSAEIRDELLATAGMAELSPSEREQLTLYMLNERKRVVAFYRGSEEAADRMLREKNLGGLTEFMKSRKREFLIQRIKEMRIMGRIQVSMRDIEVYYRQHPEKYDSPSQFVFRLIEAPTSESDRVQKIAARLESGESFDDVAASSLNSFHAAEGGRLSKPHESDKPQEASVFFGVDALNEAAQKVGVGKWSGPIPAGGSTYWIALDEIVDRKMTLFDAQIEIEETLREDRANEEFRRYLHELQEKASFTSLDQMVLSLLKIAEDQLWEGASKATVVPVTAPGPEVGP